MRIKFVIGWNLLEHLETHSKDQMYDGTDD